MRKFIVSLLVSSLFTAVCHAGGPAKLPAAYSGGANHTNTSLIGAKSFLVSFSTVPQNVVPAANGMSAYTFSTSSSVAKSGLVYFVVVSTGQKFYDYTRLVDSNSAGSWSLTAGNAKAMTPQLFALDIDTTVASGGHGPAVYDFSTTPLRFENGLVVYNSTPAIQTWIYYRYDDGSNP